MLLSIDFLARNETSWLMTVMPQVVNAENCVEHDDANDPADFSSLLSGAAPFSQTISPAQAAVTGSDIRAAASRNDGQNLKQRRRSVAEPHQYTYVERAPGPVKFIRPKKSAIALSDDSIAAAIRSTCSCCNSSGTPCCQTFTMEDVRSGRKAAHSLSESDLNRYLSQFVVSTDDDDCTATYFFPTKQGSRKEVCRSAFETLHNVSRRKLDNARKLSKGAGLLHQVAPPRPRVVKARVTQKEWLVAVLPAKFREWAEILPKRETGQVQKISLLQ